MSSPMRNLIGLKGSNQHLWNLLQGRIVVATDAVVLEELRDCQERVIKALTYYEPYEEREGDETIIFPAVPRFIRSAMEENNDGAAGSSYQSDRNTEDAGGTGGGGGGELAEPGRKGMSTTKISSFDQLRKAIGQQLKLDVNVATELLVSYMMFEYKGTTTSYEEITDTQRTFTTFMKEFKEHYIRERTCLLLCTQAILAVVGVEENPLSVIVEDFRSMISEKTWCWGLLRSIEVAQSEGEIIEILHCLLLLMYKLPNDTIPEFFTYFNDAGFSNIRKSDKMRMAEGAVMHTAILVSGITDCCTSVFPHEFAPIIRDFVSKQFEKLLLNPYNVAPVFAAYATFCKEDKEITRKMRCLPCSPDITFQAMLNLVDHYAKNSLYDRHQLSLIISASIFESFEVLLANYDINHFGSNTDGFLILSKILQHNLVAENFLCGTPLALTALYTDATSVFPLDISSLMHLWKSLCMSVRTPENCRPLIEAVSKLNCIAEQLDDDDTRLFTRRTGEFGVVNLKSRKLHGVVLDKGITGTQNSYQDSPCISWELPSSSDASAFDVIRCILEPLASRLAAMDASNVSPAEFERFDYSPRVVFAVCDFLVEFLKSTDTQLEVVTALIHPLCVIMQRLLRNVRDLEEKVKLIPYQMALVGAINDYELQNKIALFSYVYDLIPGGDTVSMVENIVLGRESVTQSKSEVALSFLDLVNGFCQNKKCWKQGHASAFEVTFLKSIGFVAESIFSSCPTWRIEDEETRYKLYQKCFQIFINVYYLEGQDWHALKKEFPRFLVTPTSCLIAMLQTISENDLLDSSIRPTKENHLLVEVMTLALRLLLQVIQFENKTLMEMDTILEGALVRVLGRLVRHRLNPKIPTLSMMILTAEVAAKTNMSLLACFGNDEAAFRDIIIQRLEFSAEDINLKIAVLEFLTVISQTQVGIIQCFFADGILENSIIDLMNENEDLSVACLRFFRSLVRQALPLPRSYKDFWRNILAPINSVKMGSRLEIITATMHILTFDLYTNGTTDTNLIKQLDMLLERESFHQIMFVVLCSSSSVAGPCITSIKHFLLLMLAREELAKLIPKETLMAVQKQVLEGFWKLGLKETTPPSISITLSEIATILTTSKTATPSFISSLVLQVIEIFPSVSVEVQLSLLCLVNKCFRNCHEPLPSETVQNTMRILKKILDYSVTFMQDAEIDEPHQIITVAATLITTIVVKQRVPVWSNSFLKDLVPRTLLSICSTGVISKKAPDVIAVCLRALIAVATKPEGSNLIPATGMSKALWLHLAKFLEEECEPVWTDVFLLCLHLNTKMLQNQKHDYVDEAIAFWGLFGGFLNHKLSLMVNIREICVVIEDNEKGYNDMKAVLSCNVFVLNDILRLVAYIEEWQKAQPSEVFKAIRGVFYVLQESFGLLGQPLLLQSSICSKSKTTTAADVRLSPKLLEMQNKLWEICDICVQILVELKNKYTDFIEKSDWISTMFQIGQLSIKALTKGERKFHSGNLTLRVAGILEKVMLIIYNYTMPVLDDATVDLKFQVAFRRELGTEVISLCDGIRRLAGVPKNEFMVTLCSKLESKFK